MKRWLTLAAAGFLVTAVDGCGHDNTVSQPYSQTSIFNLSTLTTQLPVDPGAFHNAVLAEMNAASIEPGGIENVTEWLIIFKSAVNNALAPYGPSRSVTKDECLFGLSIGRLVDPLYGSFVHRRAARRPCSST